MNWRTKALEIAGLIVAFVVVARVVLGLLGPWLPFIFTIAVVVLVLQLIMHRKRYW
jgi:hypothetical protein